jgi:DNA-binding MarR family transcriptional regulator
LAQNMHMQRLQRQANVGLLIAAARRRIKQAVGELGRPYHLSAQRFWLLLGIGEREGLSLCELAELHRIDEPTASRIVSALARQGLVRTADDPGDRRRSQLVLTRAGSELAGRLRPLAEGLRQATVEGFSAAEQRALAASLQRVAENVDRFVEARRRDGGRVSDGGGA